jgi:hypothetical protein
MGERVWLHVLAGLRFQLFRLSAHQDIVEEVPMAILHRESIAGGSSLSQERAREGRQTRETREEGGRGAQRKPSTGGVSEVVRACGTVLADIHWGEHCDSEP